MGAPEPPRIACDRAGLRPPHPFIYLILMLPFGVSSGFVIVTLAYQLSQAGVDAVQVAAVIAADLFPQTWKFLWAPIADTTLSRKSWYMIGTVLTAATTLACGLVPANAASLLLLTALVLLMSVATSFVGMSTEALIAHQTPDDAKGRAGGWLQAGNLGGQGVGGGAGLWLAQHLAAPWMSAGILGVACLLCTLALLGIRDPQQDRSRIATQGSPEEISSELTRQWARLVAVLKDLWGLARSRRGLLAMLVVFLPISTGAASNLWAAVADGWHASADTVALINGTLGGVACAFGSLLAGPLCDRLDRKVAYLLYGAAQGLCAVAMAVAPHTESVFTFFTLAYAVLNGMGYAGFSAVTLEAIGTGSAATQYNVYASLSNMPILYMGLIEGWAYTGFGASTMLFAEAALAVVAIIVFTGACVATSRRAPALAA